MNIVLQIVALILVIIAAIIHVDRLEMFRKIEIQVVLGVALVLLIFYDAVAGFLLGVTLAIIYMKLNRSLMAQLERIPGFGNISGNRQEESYVTADHLEKAQSNVVDGKALEKGVKGMEGAYGAQAIDDPVPGYDPQNQKLVSNVL